MSDVTNIKESEGAAVIQTAPTLTDDIPTMVDYLVGCINMDVPAEAIMKILVEREVDARAYAMDVDKDTRNLCKADLYVWACMGVNRKGSVSDTDNGWTHSDGGFTISTEDKRMLLKAANAIYEENGEDLVGVTKFKVMSHGIAPCFFSSDGHPLPHINSRIYVKEDISESKVSTSSNNNSSAS